MVGMNVNANALLGHVGIVEYHYAPYVNKPQMQHQSVMKIWCYL